MLTTLILAVHLAALGQVESGDRDHAMGAAGEVSRYQIRREYWAAATASQPALARAWGSEPVARVVAFDLWSARLEQFQRKQRRDPTPAELYRLWNCPADVLRPSAVERTRSERFANLLEKLQAETLRIKPETRNLKPERKKP